MTCYTCKTNDTIYICGRCQSIGYCSKKCQKEDWKTQHLNICNKQFVVGKQISIVEARSRRRSIFNRMTFPTLRLLTFSEEQQYNRIGSPVIYPHISLTIYKEETTDNFPSFVETFCTICRIISDFSLGIYKIIAFIFDQILLLNFVDFVTFDTIVGPLFNMVNDLLKKMVVEKVIPNTSVEEALKIANSLKNSLPVDYALEQNFFNVVNSPTTKDIYIISQAKLFYFMKALSDKYYYIAMWFAQIMLFKIFKEIGINRLDFVIQA
jgi:hypothetical protein